MEEIKKFKQYLKEESNQPQAKKEFQQQMRDILSQVEGEIASVIDQYISSTYHRGDVDEYENEDDFSTRDRIMKLQIHDLANENILESIHKFYDKGSFNVEA
jgi:uncharacterized protein with von Willebrand factor type A (vWA) domain